MTPYKFSQKLSSLPLFNLFTFFCLYIAQALPMSFFSTSIQVMMRQADYSLSAIAVLQIIKLPWMIKFAWSPLIDRGCTDLADYKRYIIGTEVIYAAFILTAGFLNLSSDFYWLLAIIFIALIASATQDIATDALSVRSFSKPDKSLANSMQSMGSFGGTLLGSGVLLIILQRYGWNVVMPCLSIFVLLALLPLLLNKKIRLHKEENRRRAKWTDFIWFFTQKGIGKQVGFLILYYASIIGILAILRPYLVDLGYSMKEIGIISGILGTASAFVASLIGGIVVRRIGLNRSRILFAVIILVANLFFLLLPWMTPTTTLICLGIILIWCGYGIATIVVYTSAMECVRPGCEGTDFTVQTVITHISGVLIAVFSGKLADIFGYQGLFLTEALIAIFSLIYVVYFFRKR